MYSPVLYKKRSGKISKNICRMRSDLAKDWVIQCVGCIG